MKVLMVCLGNICRSPMAEGILQHKANERGLAIEVDSCGTSAYHTGDAPDPRAQKTMRSRGIDIEQLRARQFNTRDFETFDFIFTMDDSNYRDILKLAPNDELAKKVQLFLNLSQPNENLSVPDPYFGGENGFESVFEMLDAAADAFLNQLENNG